MSLILTVGAIDNTDMIMQAFVVDAELLTRERRQIDDNSFAELIVWRVPVAVAGSAHNLKYRFAYVAHYVAHGECVLRYDNEAGKGDHKHVGVAESGYVFAGLEQLRRDFWTDVERMRQE